MKLSKMAIAAAIAMLVNVGNLSAADTTVQQVSHCAAAACDCGAPVCGCETTEGCDSGNGCDSNGCCDSGCDSMGCLGKGKLRGRITSYLDDCCHGDQWSLFGSVGNFSVGGWTQLGYFDRALPLFNSYDDKLQLQQQWFYAEKAIDTTCGFDIGGRIDYIYGTDGPDTQAFGIDNDHWDNGWDNGGAYGHAIPQLYMEAGYGKWSVKAGHFFTIIGYEVVAAPDNFFYSHSYTMFNSEPFTHTGVLSTYDASDSVDVFAGYVLGWDSGFEDNGDSFLGGISVDLTDRLNVTYATVAGRFGETRGITTPGERGYMHSIVSSYSLSDKLTYVSQSDYLSSEDPAGTTVRDTIGYNNFLLYQYNDCWGFGGRLEWYQNEGIYTDPGEEANIYALTLGTNYRPNANLIIRPEIRWDWVFNTTAVAAAGNSVLENNDGDQTTAGVDFIYLF